MTAERPPAIDREAITADLEAARSAYHQLLEAVRMQWESPSGNAEMKVRELMWHIAWSVTFLANGVDATVSGERPLMTRLPGGIMDPLRKMAMHRLAKNATPDSAAAKYDEGHAALIARLDGVRDDQWERTTQRFGETRSVGWHFRQPVDHFSEHAADVRAVLR